MDSSIGRLVRNGAWQLGECAPSDPGLNQSAQESVWSDGDSTIGARVTIGFSGSQIHRFVVEKAPIVRIARSERISVTSGLATCRLHGDDVCRIHGILLGTEEARCDLVGFGKILLDLGYGRQPLAGMQLLPTHLRWGKDAMSDTLPDNDPASAMRFEHSHGGGLLAGAADREQVAEGTTLKERLDTSNEAGR